MTIEKESEFGQVVSHAVTELCGILGQQRVVEINAVDLTKPSAWQKFFGEDYNASEAKDLAAIINNKSYQFDLEAEAIRRDPIQNLIGSRTEIDRLDVVEFAKREVGQWMSNQQNHTSGASSPRGRAEQLVDPNTMIR
jgi:hypothetical protein